MDARRTTDHGSTVTLTLFDARRAVRVAEHACDCGGPTVEACARRGCTACLVHIALDDAIAGAGLAGRERRIPCLTP